MRPQLSNNVLSGGHLKPVHFYPFVSQSTCSKVSDNSHLTRQAACLDPFKEL